jgi:hypothetical protein
MFLGCGMMVVGPRRAHGKPRVKRYFGLGWIVRRPKWWASNGQTLEAGSGHCSAEETPPNYVHAAGGAAARGLLEILASLEELDEDALRDFRRQFLAERSRQNGHRTPTSMPAPEEKQG